MKIAFVGASGYGNVGDDTYPLVFARLLAGHEVLFYNSDLPDRLPSDIGLLVIGGGGVLHNVGEAAAAPEAESPHFRCMKFYMDAAIGMGIPWGFLSCGFQFRRPYEPGLNASLTPWAHYLRQAHFVTLRSASCVRIAGEVSGREDALFFPDAGYLYDPPPQEPGQQMRNCVTVVPAGRVNATDAQITYYLRQLMSSGTSVAWLSMGSPKDDGPLLERAAALFPASEIIASPLPQEAYARIASSRLVISGRYHGMVFARASRVPFITPEQVPYKLLVEDYSQSPSSAEGHFEVLGRFLRA